ncbi:MAG: LacI family DNA-binding transcriptional regulator [Sedimentisphaeraceae bacterium JB056]
MPGKKVKSGMKDIANRLNISVTTVGRAFSNATDISPATKERIFKLAKELDYRPNLNARALVQQKTSTLGLVICNVSNPIMEGVIRDVEDSVSKEGYRLNLAISHGEPKRERDIVNDMLCRRIDGVIIHPHCLEGRSEAVESLLETKTPTVVLGNYTHSAVSQVGMDLFTAGYEITSHLLDLGHKKIACINELPGDPRFKGYIKACEERSIIIDDELSYYLPVRARSGIDICRDIIEKKSTAVFAISDALAATILEGFKLLGIKVPDDIALAGCGNDRYSSVMGPSLTSYGFPYHNLPRHLTNFILEKIDYPESTIRSAVLIGKLIPRESTLGIGTPLIHTDQTKPNF